MQSNISVKKINIFILLAIFLISVIIRFPNINRPLSNHHEWLTALSLRMISIFYDNGAYKYNFSPITNYEGAANKNIDNTSALFMPKDKEGNYYYISHLPFAYLFPYFIFRLFGAQPTILGLQIFNLILHFISAYFIFLIVSSLNKNENKNIDWPAILGFTIYTFLPLNLWFHSNIYMAEIFVQPLFIIEVYLFLKIAFSGYIKNYYYWLLGIVNFLIVYTEWLGILLAFVMGIYLLFKIKDRKCRKIFYIIALTSIFPLLLTVFQYSRSVGFRNLLMSYRDKYSLRSGFSGLSPAGTKFSDPMAWLTLVQNYIMSFFPFLLTILLTPIVFVYKKFRQSFINHKFLLAAYIIIMPIILNHLMLFSATVIHDFYFLKDSVYIAVFGSLVCGKLTQSIKKESRQALMFGFIILVGVFPSVSIYNQYNSKYSDKYKIIGEQIKGTVKNDEVVFIEFSDNQKNQIDITPQFIIYAQRNIALFKNIDQANELIRVNKLNKGVVFVMDNNYDISSINRIDLAK